MSATSQKLMQIYNAARRRFGHQHWWPGDTPLEICVGAVLTQNTNWANVEKAIANLKAAGLLGVPQLHGAPIRRLAQLIRPAGYYNVKARRLKNLIARVRKTSGDDLEAFLDRPTETLRAELLSVRGIGRETADSIVLYAAGKCTFVVDAYTCRVLLRHGLIDAEADYEEVKELLESNLPQDVALFNDFHAQFVALGKSHCRPKARCRGCPLEQLPHDPLAGVEGR